MVNKTADAPIDSLELLGLDFKASLGTFFLVGKVTTDPNVLKKEVKNECQPRP